MKNINSSNRENNFNMDFQNTEVQTLSFYDLVENCNTSPKREALKTGITFLDNNTCFYKKTISLLVGRANSKKEELLMDIALNMAIESKTVVYISFDKNLDVQTLKESFKEKCLKKSQSIDKLENLHLIIIENATIPSITNELSKINSLYDIDAVFIDDDKHLFFGENISSFKNNYILKEYISWELSELAALLNIHIFMCCRVASKCEKANYIDNIQDIKCSFGLIGLAKFVAGLTCPSNSDCVNINILKNTYGDYNIKSKITIS